MINQLTSADLMQQAKLTAESYFHTAVRVINSEFGDGYAKANPGLIGNLTRTMAADFHTAILHVELSSLTDSISNLNIGSIDSTNISQLCDSMDRSSGDMLEGCTRIAKAIEEMTGAIERTKNNE